jgi:nucleotidyltransferase/DNA polymerase involved in DNA repair
VALSQEELSDLIFVSPFFDRYKEISKNSVFFRSIRIWSSLSLDEAYLDVTQNKKIKRQHSGRRN